MIVGDERLSAYALKHQLESFGYEISSIVSSGKKAIEYSLSDNPDLILMDIYLDDDIDGIEAVQQIQMVKDIPVIYITALDDDTTVRKASTTVYIDLIFKPYQFEELHTAIENYFTGT